MSWSILKIQQHPTTWPTSTPPACNEVAFCTVWQLSHLFSVNWCGITFQESDVCRQPCEWREQRSNFKFSTTIDILPYRRHDLFTFGFRRFHSCFRIFLHGEFFLGSKFRHCHCFGVLLKGAELSFEAAEKEISSTHPPRILRNKTHGKLYEILHFRYMFQAHLKHQAPSFSSRYQECQEFFQQIIFGRWMTIFQSHPQPEKVALKSVESPESSLRFRQILQLRLDLAIVGRRGLGGMRFFVKKVLQINKQNIGCKHPMIQGPKLFVVTISWFQQRFIPSSLNITQQRLVDV